MRFQLCVQFRNQDCFTLLFASPFWEVSIVCEAPEKGRQSLTGAKAALRSSSLCLLERDGLLHCAIVPLPRSEVYLAVVIRARIVFVVERHWLLAFRALNNLRIDIFHRNLLSGDMKGQ